MVDVLWTPVVVRVGRVDDLLIRCVLAQDEGTGTDGDVGTTHLELVGVVGKHRGRPEAEECGADSGEKGSVRLREVHPNGELVNDLGVDVGTPVLGKSEHARGLRGCRLRRGDVVEVRFDSLGVERLTIGECHVFAKRKGVVELIVRDDPVGREPRHERSVRGLRDERVKNVALHSGAHVELTRVRIHVASTEVRPLDGIGESVSGIRGGGAAGQYGDGGNDGDGCADATGQECGHANLFLVQGDAHNPTLIDSVH